MRIGIFTESYERIVNGVSVCVTTLRDELETRGHEVFVFAPDFKGFQDHNSSVIRFPSVRTFQCATSSPHSVCCDGQENVRLAPIGPGSYANPVCPGPVGRKMGKKIWIAAGIN